MKGGKEEGKKVVEPLFPRLHVNDREKGGPRAPPRNKMALYEQFSIPSQKLNSLSSAATNKAASLVDSSFSSKGYRQEKSASSPSDVPAQPSVQSEKRVQFQSSDSSLTSTGIAILRSTKRQANSDAFSANGSVGTSSLHLSDPSNAKKSRQRNSAVEDDFMVPTFMQSVIATFSNKKISNIESERLTTWSIGNLQKISSNSSPSSTGTLKGTNTDTVMLKNIEPSHIEQRQTGASDNKVSKVIFNSRRIFSSTSSFTKKSSGQDNTDTVIDGKRCIDIDAVNKGDNPRVRRESHSEVPLVNSQIAPIEAQKCGQESNHNKANGSMELEDVDKNEVSEDSLPDSEPSMVICPDDVVGVIGPKHFWKARRAIVDQQRIFAIQVFELHRLIKVQKSLAASPDVSEKSHEQNIEQEVSSQKPQESSNSPDENIRNDLNQISQQYNIG